MRREVESWPLDMVFPIHPRLRSLALRVIMRTVFGDETSALEILHKRILDMLAVTDSFVLVEPRLRHLPRWRGTWRSFERRRHEVDRLISDAIVRARHAGAGSSGRDGVLDGLLQVHNTDGSPYPTGRCAITSCP